MKKPEIIVSNGICKLRSHFPLTFLLHVSTSTMYCALQTLLLKQLWWVWEDQIPPHMTLHHNWWSCNYWGHVVNNCVNSLWYNMYKLRIKLLLTYQCSLSYKSPDKCASKTSQRMYRCQIMKEISTPSLQSHQILFATNDTNQNFQSADLDKCTHNFSSLKMPTQGTNITSKTFQIKIKNIAFHWIIHLHSFPKISWPKTWNYNLWKWSISKSWPLNTSETFFPPQKGGMETLCTIN